LQLSHKLDVENMGAQLKFDFGDWSKDQTPEPLYSDSRESFFYIQELFSQAKYGPEVELIGGVKWGKPDKLFTPAYWKAQYLLWENDNSLVWNNRLGENLLEEVVACLLGGYGIRAELGLAAFQRVRDQGLIASNTSESAILNALSEPFDMGGAKKIHYRFYSQKSKFIYQFLNRKDVLEAEVLDDVQLRNWLLTINGIGPKTASWITRNLRESDEVAILDIHIIRAGILAGLFPPDADPSKGYFQLEKRFLDFAVALEAKASLLDGIIWWNMKKSNRLALDSLF
jgi:N-glycosylase/DNA lyase